MIVPGTLARRVLGTYGVYVVCSPTGGCLGGGGKGPERGAMSVFCMGVVSVSGETGKLDVELVGDDVADDEGVPLVLDEVGDMEVGTTSG